MRDETTGSTGCQGWGRRTLLAMFAGTAIALAAMPASAVQIIITNTDQAGEGFNEDTPAAPVGRNPGTTIGEQRLYVFQYAADAWGLRLKGNVKVIVSASFDQLEGDETGAILGQAAPLTVHRDFPGVAKPGTWYVAALANQYRGRDLTDVAPEDCPIALLDGQCPEIQSQFNSEVDDDVVLGDINFYYGVDGNAGGDVDFLSVVLHEIGHGLGVLDLLNPFDGSRYFDFNDAFIDNLEDKNINPKQVSAMSDLQRQRAITDDGALVWVGPSLVDAASTLASGRLPNGAVQMFAPHTYQSGSSVAHVDTDLFPNELMEPYIPTPAPHGLRLTLAMLRDIGWQLSPTAALCGDANNDNAVTSTDALQTLRAAVGSSECPAEVCDVSSPGGVSSSDALPVLRYSVGQPVSLSCP